jgi:hypothetical protein
MSNTPEQLNSEQRQAVLLFQIEQKVRLELARQVELKFHSKYHDAAHDIALFIRHSG